MNIDLFPTIAKWVGAELPGHRIDGKDVLKIITAKKSAKNPHDAYWFYYEQNQLQAVTSGDGRWKLQLPHSYRSFAGQTGRNNGMPESYLSKEVKKSELYDLLKDVSETTDIADKHPDIVKRLEAEAEKARAELGDKLVQRTGKGVREPGRLAE